MKNILLFSRLFIYSRQLPYFKEIIFLCQDNIARVVVESAHIDVYSMIICI